VAGVAKNNAKINDITISSYVSYSERYRNGWDNDGYDDDGNPINERPHYSTTSWSTNAKVSGSISSSHTVYAEGTSIATTGDSLQGQWVADPYPSAHYGGSISNVSPGYSGSTGGSVSSGSSSVFVNGKGVASIGSSVSVSIGGSSSISDGSSSVFIG
jgi:uncharacterized Zn-binding protein involved in type VI secretion